jgi:hypothetical protein
MFSDDDMTIDDRLTGLDADLPEVGRVAHARCCCDPVRCAAFCLEFKRLPRPELRDVEFSELRRIRLTRHDVFFLSMLMHFINIAIIEYFIDKATSRGFRLGMW